jgi:hypothetical protein
MRKYLFLFLPLVFAWFATSSCKKGCGGNSKDEPPSKSFDFRLSDKNTGMNTIGSIYHKDTVKLYNLWDGKLTESFRLFTDPVSGFFARGVSVEHFGGPDYAWSYRLYLNKADSDTIMVKDMNVGDCPARIGFFYNGVLIAEHIYQKQSQPLIEFKK